MSILFTSFISIVLIATIYPDSALMESLSWNNEQGKDSAYCPPAPCTLEWACDNELEEASHYGYHLPQPRAAAPFLQPLAWHLF
ncbi:hypothetical protein F5878DRAFT_667516 [Lentinula raphanica]|uniref:Uncharacterized protein n=1 Tax=Lentinula raphanica TaxID=153919 RepID=A0AA38NVN1_9AGAR|nr:hypothetical protein F5878DRAFT_667516 [Lentinula raphanica]